MAADTAAERTAFEGWAILELMGHRRLGGFVKEQEIAGAAFIRIDVPGQDDEGVHSEFPVATQFYAPAAVYCVTPTTEEMARLAARMAAPEPISEWEAKWATPAIERAEDAEEAEVL